MDRIIVGIAEGKTAGRGQVLVSYALGSCVGVCLYDCHKGIAGMAHVVLPEKRVAVHQSNIYKFADEGVRALVRQMGARGCDKSHLFAKIAGGAQMFDTQSDAWNIGASNVAAVKNALDQENIPIIGQDTGKNYGRTLFFYADDGKLEIKTVRHLSMVL